MHARRRSSGGSESAREREKDGFSLNLRRETSEMERWELEVFLEEIRFKPCTEDCFHF